MKSGQRKLAKLTRIVRIARRKACGRKSRLSRILQALRYYCSQTTLHGLRYVVDPDLSGIERFLWLVLFVLSFTISCNVIYSLAFRFQTMPTTIHLESMTYEASNLPFPSVTLCPNDRIDWNRALELEQRIFANSTDDTSLETYRRILGKLSAISFGDFDDLQFLKDPKESELVDNLAGINITKVMRDVMPRCEQLLSACWWRNSHRNCCDIFEVQKTEYGFCYSFNSQTAEPPSRSRSAESRPRRAFGYGEWSGIKVTIHLGNVTKPPNSVVNVNGVVVMINGPNVWPNSGTMIPSGSLVSTSLTCVSGFATQRVLELDDDKQPCQYDETGKYNQESCLSLCKRYHVAKYCGCNPSFLFPATNRFRDCTIKDFICLIDHNDLFNDYMVHFDEERFAGVSRMICKCLPECDYYVYGAQYTNVPLRNVNDIMLDVHYMGQTSFRYKTDIIITQMDLLVSFGGIIGLFLGGSLLSAAELIYYLMVALCSSLRWRPRPSAHESRTRSSSTTIVHTTVLPLLDYRKPLKPRAKRIPIFTNYTLAESNLNRY